MCKKLVLSILISVLALAPAIPVNAGPKETILIEDLSYTVTTVKQGILQNGNLGLRLLAVGGGTIDCQGVAACEDLGLQDATATFAQVIELIFSFDPGTDTISGKVKGRTVGQFNPGPIDIWEDFRGRIRGTADCSAGVCDVSLNVRAKTENGGRLIRVNRGELVNDSSLGWVFVSLGGSASFTADWDRVQ